MTSPALPLKLYLAAPLFSVAERSFNSFLSESLRRHCDVYLPQEDGALMPTLLESGHSVAHASKIVFKNDLNAIRQCDILLIVMDGRAIDEGACLELGIAYALGKKCIGLQTDFRRLASFGNNPMIEGALDCVYENIDSLLQSIMSIVKERN